MIKEDKIYTPCFTKLPDGNMHTVDVIRDLTLTYLCVHGISCHVWYYDEISKNEVEVYGVLQKGLTDGIYRIGTFRFDEENVKRVKYADHYVNGVIFKDFKFELKEEGKKNE